MPELPEVETYARQLAVLKGRTFLGAQVDWARSVPTGAEALGPRIAGQTILAVQRRGKYIVFQLSDDWLLVHLKMTGELQVQPAREPVDIHHRVVFDLDGGEQLRFHDPRKFGRVYLVADPAEVTGPLGPEPLEELFTPEVLQVRLHGRRGRLKSLLLDQTFVAGLGNIYADEALHRARLHPLRAADTLTADEQARLYQAIRDVLAQGVANRGTNLDWAYTQGTNQDALRVFHRHGQPCPTCGTPVERILVGQRGTHFCPQCQPPPPRGGAG
ncbi:MAG: bifunctional DNA-formamidopyrimidine glycosylase/DNA-(apurinic or apyrimidinic site) lyase [Anaerolineae bacterium]|nr:bifunctional DNA-formamidopyrimidine glycosylase/DNA-(apurinic or apyrimidinic site) lyase [Anaerolineae bacterium]